MEGEWTVRRKFLIPFPILAGIVGLGYMLGGSDRYISPSFDPAKAIMPLPAWGLAFIVGSATLTLTLLLCRSRWVAGALLIGGAVYMFWGICFGVAALTEPEASLGAWAKELALALAHYYAAYRVMSSGTP